MRLFLALLSIVTLIAGPSWACPSGSSCVRYLAFSGENVLAPSGDTTGATDVAAINAAIGQGKPNFTQSVVRLGAGTFYINPTQVEVWPYTTIEGHYLSAADGSTGTTGGTILKAAGSWSSTVTTTGPAVVDLTDRNTLRNLTIVGLGGSTPDCVRADDIHSDDFQNVDVVNCHDGWNVLADSALTNCGTSPYYPHQGCASQLFHWFLGNVIGSSAYGVAIGGINSGYASDSFMTGMNFYGNASHVATPGTCGAALGVSWSFAEFSGATGAGISNNCNMWMIVGNQIENASPPLYLDRTNSYQPFPLVGNQVGNSTGTGPMVHVTSNWGGAVAGNLYYAGCPYQVDNALSGLAWYEAPNAAFGCNSGSTTNLDSIIIAPGSPFP